MYDVYFEDIHEYYFFLYNNLTNNDYDYNKYRKYYEYLNNNYFYNKYIDRFPCQEIENIGTEDNPLYSCIKCYEFISEKNYKPVRITEENSKVSYCLETYYEELDNCIEATYKIKKGREIYNCTKCAKYNSLVYNKFTNTYHCQYTMTKCLVLYCQKCNHYNGNICEQCFPDYELNIFSGYCVKKTEKVPYITWKDIYGFIFDTMKIINNILLFGPFLKLRGITSSQINLRHSFIIYLTFRPKTLFRNLEESEIKIPALCVIIEDVEETNNDFNIVEYDCIGNYTGNENLTNFSLFKLEEGNNTNILKQSNVNDLASSIDIANLEKKLNPDLH